MLEELFKNSNLGEDYFRRWFLSLSKKDKILLFGEIDGVIKRFYRFWDELPEEIREAIKSYKNSH